MAFRMRGSDMDPPSRIRQVAALMQRLSPYFLKVSTTIFDTAEIGVYAYLGSYTRWTRAF
jgi:hypothetical protein